MELEIPIELECWMLKWGILPKEHLQPKPDVVWRKKETPEAYAVRTGQSMSWMPSVAGEEPPF